MSDFVLCYYIRCPFCGDREGVASCSIAPSDNSYVCELCDQRGHISTLPRAALLECVAAVSLAVTELDKEVQEKAQHVFRLMTCEDEARGVVH